MGKAQSWPWDSQIAVKKKKFVVFVKRNLKLYINVANEILDAVVHKTNIASNLMNIRNIVHVYQH